MRFVFALLIAATLAAVAAPDVLAVRFADTPCVETGETRSRVCPAGVVGDPYRIQLVGEGGCGPALPYQFRSLSGSLPPGLTLDKAGRLHGTPTTAGTWSFWLELSDEDPPSADWCLPKRSEREFVVTVGAPPATVGSPYAVQVTAQGSGPQTWSIAAGTLPPGLALGRTTGVIVGKPATTGAFPFKLAVSDERGIPVLVDLTIVVYPRLELATKRLVPGKVGRPYRATVRTSGGARPLTFRVRSGRLPIGMRLNTQTGVLSGTPRKAGSYRVTIEARDGLRRTASQAYVVRVRSASV